GCRCQPIVSRYEKRRKIYEGRGHEAEPFLEPVLPSAPVEKQQNGNRTFGIAVRHEDVQLLEEVSPIGNIELVPDLRNDDPRQPHARVGVLLGTGAKERAKIGHVVKRHRQIASLEPAILPRAGSVARIAGAFQLSFEELPRSPISKLGGIWNI